MQPRNFFVADVSRKKDSRRFEHSSAQGSGELPGEDDTESAIRAARRIAVDAHAIPIEVANDDEAAVRALCSCPCPLLLKQPLPFCWITIFESDEEILHSLCRIAAHEIVDL